MGEEIELFVPVSLIVLKSASIGQLDVDPIAWSDSAASAFKV